MSVIRVEKTKDYTVMSNYHLRDQNLSLKAKGLMSLMLSLPENWDYTIEGLVRICKENDTAVTNALKELKENGYLVVKKKFPNETATGRIEYEYNLFERKQFLEKQPPENLPIENQGQLNTNNKILNNKLLRGVEKENKEKETNKLVFPTLNEVKQFAKLKGHATLAEKFYNWYEQNNWLDKYGKPVLDWKLKFMQWVNTEPKENNNDTGIKHQDKELTPEELSYFDEFLNTPIDELENIV